MRVYYFYLTALNFFQDAIAFDNYLCEAHQLMTLPNTKVMLESGPVENFTLVVEMGPGAEWYNVLEDFRIFLPITPIFCYMILTLNRNAFTMLTIASVNGQNVQKLKLHMTK